VAGILTGVLVLGEPVGLLDVLGLLVTSAGIMVVLRAQRGSPAASPGTAAAGGNDEMDRQLEVVLADGADLPAPGSRQH
jgi:drug/metabolite transporter (DMT)-like permease